MDSPPIGTLVKCLVCALDKPWGTFSTTTGEAICVDCRDARHKLDAAEQRLREVEDERDKIEVALCAAAAEAQGIAHSGFTAETWALIRVAISPQAAASRPVPDLCAHPGCPWRERDALIHHSPGEKHCDDVRCHPFVPPATPRVRQAQ